MTAADPDLSSTWTGLDALPSALVVVRLDGVVVHHNPAAERLFGWPVTDARGLPLPMVPADARPRALEFVEGVGHHGRSGPLELTAAHREGAALDVEVVGSLLLGQPADAPLIVLGVTDVSARRALERSMLESEARHQQAIGSGGFGVWTWDLTTHGLTASDRYFHMLGHQPVPPEHAAAWLIAHMPREDVQGMLAAVRAHLTSGAPYRVEIRVRGADGALRWIETTGTAVRDATGRPTHLSGTMHDITARRAAEDAVRASEDRYVRATESAGIGIWHWDLPDGVLVASPMYAKIVGHPPAALASGVPWFREHAHPEDLGRFQAILRAHLDKHNPFIAELRFRGADGTWRWLEFAGQAERDGAGVPRHMMGTVRDVTDRVEVQQALRERDGHLRLLADHAQDLVGLMEADGRIVFISASVFALLGWKPAQLVRRDMFELAHPDDEARMRAEHAAVLAGRDVTGLEMRMRHRDGSYRWFEASARPVFDTQGQVGRFHVIARDITERRAADASRRELEQQLVQTQKMEAIGTLAGGIAHDFNNILGAIIGFTELARMDLPPASEPAECLTHVLAASERAKRLVAQILAFSRRGSSEQVPVELSVLLTETRSLLRATLPSSVKLAVTIADDTGCIRGNVTQLQQVMLNLAGNAEHAMRPGGGTLTIEISRVGTAPDEYVRIAVRDTGAGIRPEVAARAFDPFFTTKPVGEGTGMGLAVVHGIVSAHRGRISLAAHPEGGTVAEVMFPALSREAEDAPVTTSGRIPLAPPAPGARLMVVDDEPALVSALVRLGTRLGLRVTGFVSSSEALRRFAGNPQAFDILLTDQTMPGISGEELISYVRAIRPNLPVILCTGFSHTLSAERAAEIGIDVFLAKPVSAHQLADALAEVTASARA